jgi:hypothetical protein
MVKVDAVVLLTALPPPLEVAADTPPVADCPPKPLEPLLVDVLVMLEPELLSLPLQARAPWRTRTATNPTPKSPVDDFMRL